MSQRRVNRSNTEEVEENIESAINECVRYIVIREGSKIPIKRAEIAKHLNSTCQTPSNQVNSVIIEANKVLKRVYGYKLIQVESKSGIQYIVVLNEEGNSQSSCIPDPLQRKMLIAALTHIYMTGGPVKEEEMWKFLSEAGLMEENDHTARKVLTNTFTRQMYLQYSKVGEGEIARNVFEWGQRAEEEVPKMFILNKMAEAFGKEPNHWHEQYREATVEASS
ncbi:non-structural maintenance of chromosomes element 3 homolog [Galleria mellonella]|uniref:Non-structural maintenance of chromosomes element 3 homolog n=1 Tax=Galleria mellonella TaxID=7137 RepID=A0A6J1WRT8_GALME|nr:non-structural maintenance of chromosomes element 3 homolog [Galleria mellonella]